MQFADETFIGIALSAAKLVVEMRNHQRAGDDLLIAQDEQRVQQGNAIGTARYGNNDAIQPQTAPAQKSVDLLNESVRWSHRSVLRRAGTIFSL